MPREQTDKSSLDRADEICLRSFIEVATGNSVLDNNYSDFVDFMDSYTDSASYAARILVAGTKYVKSVLDSMTPKALKNYKFTPKVLMTSFQKAGGLPELMYLSHHLQSENDEVIRTIATQFAELVLAQIEETAMSHRDSLLERHERQTHQATHQ